MKNIYFAGHMEIDFENKELSNLTQDYRCCLVDSEKILMPFEPIPLNEEYAYGWPSFYYADENGNPSLSSKLILEQEFSIIPDIDILVVFLQEKPTAGTMGEIMYAAQNKKPMHVYYMPSPTESELYNTNQWYVIGMAEKINPGNITVTEVEDLTGFLNALERDFKIKPMRFPRPKDNKVIMLEGYDGSGKTSIAKQVAENIGAKYIHFFSDYGVSYSIEPLSITEDELVSMTKKALDRSFSEKGTVILDRGLITPISALPKDRWGEFKEYFDKIDVVMCYATVEDTVARLKLRTTDESTWYDNEHWVETNMRIAEYFEVPIVNTSTSGSLKNSVDQAMELLGYPQTILKSH